MFVKIKVEINVVVKCCYTADSLVIVILEYCFSLFTKFCYNVVLVYLLSFKRWIIWDQWLIKSWKQVTYSVSWYICFKIRFSFSN